MAWGRRWEGGSRGRGHRYTYGWLVQVDVWQKPTQYCNYPSIKKKKKRKKRNKMYPFEFLFKTKQKLNLPIYTGKKVLGVGWETDGKWDGKVKRQVLDLTIPFLS